MSQPLTDLPDWWNVAFDEHCLEVGRVSALWAALEYAIDRLIWNLLDAHPTMGACLTGQMIGPGPRMRAVYSLADIRGVNIDTVERLKLFEKRMKRLQGKRNRYMHDTLHIGPLSGIVKRREITADKKLRMKDSPASIDHARKLWIETQAACVEVYAITNEILGQTLVPLENLEHRPWLSKL